MEIPHAREVLAVLGLTFFASVGGVACGTGRGDSIKACGSNYPSNAAELVVSPETGHTSPEVLDMQPE